jgi:hypothetical protein
LQSLQAEADKLQAETERMKRESALQLKSLQAEADKLQADTERMKHETEQVLAEMDKQTRRIMRDLGVNLRIVHRDTNMGNLYTDFVAVDFPEEYVQRLATSDQIETIVHLVATLQERIKWRERTCLLVGTLPVTTEAQKGEEKTHMVQPVEPGTVLVGHELGVGLKEGESIEVEGRAFKIAKIMPEYGGLQDVQLLLDLHDAQQVLNKPGRINQILALNCKCKGDRLSIIRQELESVLPDTKVTEHKTQAEAREKQRDLVEATRKAEVARVEATLARVAENRKLAEATHAAEIARAEANLARVVANRDRQAAGRQRQQQMLTRLIGITTPLVVLASALFVGLMTWMNVGERRPEIGVLRALGKTAWNIGSLFLGRSVLLGTIGGAVGCLLGCFFTPLIGSLTMETSASLFRVAPQLIVATLVGAPLVSVMASYLPTLSAVSQDPALVLMDN